MERFTAAIQDTIRNMGVEFIKAVATLRQVEGDSEEEL